MLPYSVVEHSSSAILPILKACKTVRDIYQIHTRIIRRGYEQDHFLISQFLSIFANVSPSNLSYPTSVFNSVFCPNLYLWNILMKAHCESYSLGECFSLFGRMRRESNVCPDKYTFPSLIKACSSGLALREGRIVHGLTVRSGTDGDVFVGSSLIDFYGKCKEIECARKVFDGMSWRNEVSWTALMVGYLNSGDVEAAQCLFDEMPKRNESTWNAMIKGLVKMGDVKNARKLFDTMPVRNEVSFTTLIDGYAKAGDMAAARSLFDELPQKDLVSWSALMSGYVQNGKPGEAVKAFSEMRALNLNPDEFILVSLMSACSQLGSLELANWIESYIKEGSFDLKRTHVAAALVDMNAKCGNMERATSLFEDMPKRDLISYCSMIQGLSIHGCGAQAVLLFDRMIDEGKLKDAYELIQSMPVESHAAWGALLGACRLHSDVELGEMVAQRLFELEPHNAGNYVLLSNIYADADKWLNVFSLRDKMSERGVRKIPGCSYVDSTNQG
ncbi:hypothetical protein ACS0TY_009409 [Phlomoides rotata]